MNDKILFRLEDISNLNQIIMHLETKIDKISRISENINNTEIEKLCDSSSELVSEVLTILENNIR